MKTFEEFVNEAENFSWMYNRSSKLEGPVVAPEKEEMKVYPRCILDVTQEQIEYARKREKTFPSFMLNSKGRLSKAAFNGLLAEVVIKDELERIGIIDVARDEDLDTITASDGGVDLVVNNIRCDVKAGTSKNGIISKDIHIPVNKHEGEKLKNSHFLICAVYDEVHNKVHLWAVIPTALFIHTAKKLGQKVPITEEDGRTRINIYLTLDQIKQRFRTYSLNSVSKLVNSKYLVGDEIDRVDNQIARKEAYKAKRGIK